MKAAHTVTLRVPEGWREYLWASRVRGWALDYARGVFGLADDPGPGGYRFPVRLPKRVVHAICARSGDPPAVTLRRILYTRMGGLPAHRPVALLPDSVLSRTLNISRAGSVRENRFALPEAERTVHPQAGVVAEMALARVIEPRFHTDKSGRSFWESETWDTVKCVLIVAAGFVLILLFLRLSRKYGGPPSQPMAADEPWMPERFGHA